MAVAQTGAIYKALSFDNVSSRSFGVYITGEAVYNAPERDVEMITIPGRNGSFALDNGRFENITVTYPAGIFADNEADFSEAISDFRNWLCSRKGYVRLSDEYNPGEYRLAVYRSGLEVSPAQLRAGEFTISFDCKPQRFLTSGETAEAVTSGGTITNPTLFESKPMLLAEGYGDINIGGGTITIDNVPLGETKIAEAISGPSALTQTIDTSGLNTGDAINYSAWETTPSKNGPVIEFSIRAKTGIRLNAITHSSGFSDALTIVDTEQIITKRVPFTLARSYVYVSTGQNKTETGRLVIHYREEGNPNFQTNPFDVTLNSYYNGHAKIVVDATPNNELDTNKFIFEATVYLPEVIGDSTKLALAQPAHIDLDIGEAYGEIGGAIVSLNGNISIPAELPTLSPGANTITYVNTITSLQVVPRWWKI